MAFKSNNKKIEKTVVVKCRCCGNTSREITDSFWKESDIESFERRWSEEGIVDININPFGYQFVLCDNCLLERAGDYMDKLTLPEIKGTEKQLEYVLGFRNNFVKEFFLDIQRMFVKLELEDRYFKKYDLSDEQKAAFVKAADSFTGTTQKLTEMMQKLLNSKKGTDVDFWFNVNRRGLSLEEISEIIYPIEELVECNIRMSDFESDMRDFLREMNPKNQ